MMLRWLKFNTAGLLGAGLQLGVLQLLTSVWSLDYLVATAIAVETAVLHNFLWHEKYTWRSRVPDTRSAMRRLMYFHLSNGAVSLMGNLELMRVLRSYGIPLVAANVCAIAACSILNFIVAEFFVFAKKEGDEGELFV